MIMIYFELRKLISALSRHDESINRLSTTQSALFEQIAKIVGFYNNSITTPDAIDIALRKICQDGHQKESEQVFEIVKEIYNFDN